MRPLVLTIFALAAAASAPPALAQQAYRTDTGPGVADFSGVEVGPDLGFVFGNTGSYSTSGGAFGGHIGYTLQRSQIVGGVEADAMWTNLSSGSGGPLTFNENFLTSVRGKAGYAFGAFLAYGTLGIGWGTTDTTSWLGNRSSTVDGAVFGLGAEYALTRNVSFRVEYLRYQFGNVSYGYSFPYATQTVDASTNMLRLGASVHF
jgi:outer membrane immunogenic protein